MTNENRIIKVEIEINGEGFFEVNVTKEFAPEYGGGTQVFWEMGGRSLHHALDVARGMVTVSPGRRTNLPEGSAYETCDRCGKPYRGGLYCAECTEHFHAANRGQA
jgi:hypothetical protein